MRAGDSHDGPRRIIEGIRLYAQFHFLSEENLMIDPAYPRLKEHRQEYPQLL